MQVTPKLAVALARHHEMARAREAAHRAVSAPGGVTGSSAPDSSSTGLRRSRTAARRSASIGPRRPDAADRAQPVEHLGAEVRWKRAAPIDVARVDERDVLGQMTVLCVPRPPVRAGRLIREQAGERREVRVDLPLRAAPSAADVRRRSSRTGDARLLRAERNSRARASGRIGDAQLDSAVAKPRLRATVTAPRDRRRRVASGVSSATREDP